MEERLLSAALTQTGLGDGVMPSSFALMAPNSSRSTWRRRRSAGDSVRLTSFLGQQSNATLHLPLLLLQGRGNQKCDSTDRLGPTIRDSATTGFHVLPPA